MAGKVKSANRCFKVDINNKQYDCCLSSKDDPDQTSHGIILTHGAGGDMNNKQLTLVAEMLAEAGYLVLRFTCKGLNLGYRTKVFKGILEYMKDGYPQLTGCFLGGRSMGSRAAVGVCCDKTMTDFIQGVICLSNPLHTPKDSTKLRDLPLYEIGKPILFVSGTEDNMCKQELFLPVLDNMTKYEVHWINGGNHALEVPGKSIEEIVKGINHVIVTWIEKTVTNGPKRTKHQKHVKKKIKS